MRVRKQKFTGVTEGFYLSERDGFSFKEEAAKFFLLTEIEAVLQNRRK